MEVVELLVQQMNREFEADGWHVNLRRSSSGVPNAWELAVEHTLSGGHGLRLDAPDPEADLQRVRDFFARREFEIVRDRPSEMPHLTLIGSLRQLLLGHSLDKSVAISLARVLHAHDVITLDEECWLEAAGPAWSE
jgi:hypothetical protein